MKLCDLAHAIEHIACNISDTSIPVYVKSFGSSEKARADIDFIELVHHFGEKEEEYVEITFNKKYEPSLAEQFIYEKQKEDFIKKYEENNKRKNKES